MVIGVEEGHTQDEKVHGLVGMQACMELIAVTSRFFEGHVVGMIV